MEANWIKCVGKENFEKVKDSIEPTDGSISVYELLSAGIDIHDENLLKINGYRLPKTK